MPQADDGPITPRADAELMRLAEQFHTLNSAFHELTASPGYCDAQTPEVALLARRQRNSTLKLAEMPAATDEGRCAKVACRSQSCTRDLTAPLGWDTVCEFIGISLARDLVGAEEAQR